MRPDGVRLKHEPDVALFGRNKNTVAIGDNNLPLQANLAAVGLFETGEEPKRRAFPASTGAEQTEELPSENLEADVVDGVDSSVTSTEPLNS